MSDSIYVRNSALNDSDSLSSSSSIKIIGVLPAPIISYHMDTISTTVFHNKAHDIFLDRVYSCNVVNVLQEDITANYIGTKVACDKDTVRTYVLGESRNNTMEIEPITIEVAFSTTHSKINVGNNNALLIVNNGLAHKDETINVPMSMTKVVSSNAIQINSNLVSTKVMTEDKYIEEGFVKFPMVSIDVNNDYPNAEGPIGGASGGDLERMVFTIQQMSFFEFRFYFKSNKVSNVINLPQGLQFDKDKQRMFGTPLLSGRYPINIILEDESNVQGIIDVPKLYREL